MGLNSSQLNDKVIVSAPGKIHLMGEHAVVYGKPALISAINLRLYTTVEKNKEFLIVASETKLVEEAVNIVQNKLRLDRKPKVKITINSQIPEGRHAGSSAAVSVAVAGALIYFLKKIWNPILFNELAYEVEKKQHGNPSGGDNTTVTFGGFIWYRKELEFLKSMWQLPFKPSEKLAPFILINTGRPKEHTGEMVALVSAFIKKHPEKALELLNINEQAVKDMTIAIKTGNEKLLINSIKNGQRTLEGLGTVSKRSASFIRKIEKLGWAAKVCGGGGKTGPVGFLLCYTKDKKVIEKLSKKHNYSVRSILLGEEGVRLESGKQ